MAVSFIRYFKKKKKYIFTKCLTELLFSIPAVKVTLGDVLVMNVHNSLNEPTALHAHGQFQNGTNWMDGPVMVTQW